MTSYFAHPIRWYTAAAGYVPSGYADRALLAQLTEPTWPLGPYSSSPQGAPTDAYEGRDEGEGGGANFDFLFQAPLVASQYRVDVLKGLLQERDRLRRRLLEKLGSHRCQLEQRLDSMVYGSWHAGLAQQRTALEAQLVRVEQAEVKEETEAFRDAIFLHKMLLDARERVQKDAQLARLLHDSAPAYGKSPREGVPP